MKRPATRGANRATAVAAGWAWLVVLGVAVGGVACDDLAPGGGTSTAQPPATSAPAPAKPVETPADGVELQKLVLASGVAQKEPTDVLTAAKAGQRVYAHLTVRNRTTGPQRVSVSFRVNEDERTLVDLEVQKAWSWRTWAYVTLRKEDRGELTVHVFDDHGAELGTSTIPIR